MPDTPNFAITYPCVGSAISASSFATFATDVETAIAAVDNQGYGVGSIGVLNVSYAFTTLSSNPAFGVETVMTFSNTTASDIGFGASSFTASTPGPHTVSVLLSSPQSTLTITSQRVAIYVNGVLNTANKWRGSNPPDFAVFNGGFSTDIYLVGGDIVTFRYLWTGTGALGGPVTGTASLLLLATP